MLKVYLDDTGNGDQAVGGCVASTEAWRGFETSWRKALTEFSLTWFHAVDFENRRPGFDHLSDSQRTHCLKRLLGVLKSDIAQRSGGYACATTVAQLVTMMKGIAASDKPERKPQAQKTEMDRFIEQVVDLESDAYCSSLGVCLTLVLDNFVVPANEQLHVLVAHQQKRDRKIGFLYGILAGTEKYGPYVSGISHGKEMDPRMILPLQAADFAAYYLGRALRRRRENNVRAWVADELQPHFVKVADAGWATLGWLKGY